MLEKVKKFASEYLVSCLLIFVVFAVATGIAYPLFITGVAQVAFKARADGSLVKDRGRTVGSKLIGQDFRDARYFHGRPSAAGAKGYDATASGASNLGPTNPDLLRNVAARAAAVRQENGLAPGAPVPADLVESSGSGLDPEICPQSARIQVRRIARVRKLPERAILKLVQGHTRQRQLGVLGEPGVNVLELNLALDRM
jgi:potassium-transporting ATPase KdpC subunit